MMTLDKQSIFGYIKVDENHLELELGRVKAKVEKLGHCWVMNCYIGLIITILCNGMPELGLYDPMTSSPVGSTLLPASSSISVTIINSIG
jgi:hypothetical protein